jgi:hypothetical protein
VNIQQLSRVLVAIMFAASLGQMIGAMPSAARAEESPGPNRADAKAQSGIASKPVVVEQWASVDAVSPPGQQAKFVLPEGSPIRRDIKLAVELATRSLAQHVNRDRCRRPPLDDPANRATTAWQPGLLPELYWGSDRLADGTGRFNPVARSHALDNGVAHVVGRALWAILLAQETVGINPEADSLDILTRYCRDMYHNPDHLSAFMDPANGFERSVVLHDQREGFLGLLALARVRQDVWARDELREVVASLEKSTDEQGRLSAEKAKQSGLKARLLGAGNDATTSGRLVEPLMEYFALTGDERALKLAGRFARATLESTFTQEGRFREVSSSGGHIHSITSSLCGITRYAIRTNDADLIARCRRILDVGVAEYSSSWGWVDEVMPEHTANEISRGEINQTGDVIRTALLLGQAGYPQYYELAERFLRGCLLPAQYQEDDVRRILRPVESPQDDSQREVPARIVGGYSMFLPNDRQRAGVWPLTTQDIISGGVHALCECWQHRCTGTDDAVRVNLLFDYDGPEATIQSDLPQKGRVRFLCKKAKPLFVRFPDWADAKTLKVTLRGESLHVEPANGYIKIVPAAAGDEGCVEFAIPCRIQRETVDGTEYTSMWVGNQPVRILPQGAISPLPF